MNIESRIIRYNDLTDAWNKGCEWAEQERSILQNAKALQRFQEILGELHITYNILQAYGIKVKAGEKLQLNE